jgi:PAN domain
MMAMFWTLTILIAGWVVLVLPNAAQAQLGVDRRGGDYEHFAVVSGDPGQCAARCERDGRCRAWTFSYPAAPGANAFCWLKNRVTPRIQDSCCISGVKGGDVAEPHTDAFEHAIDRFGGDYRDFELAPDPTGAACKAVCEGENRCRVWTYVRPGYLGASARCYLKDRITPPRRKPCCISGVVR